MANPMLPPGRFFSALPAAGIPYFTPVKMFSVLMAQDIFSNNIVARGDKNHPLA